jgi:hypothetical protein
MRSRQGSGFSSQSVQGRFMIGSDGEASQSFLRTDQRTGVQRPFEWPAHPSLHGTTIRWVARNSYQAQAAARQR